MILMLTINAGKDPEPSPAKGDIATITSSTSTFSTTSIEFGGLGNRNDNIEDWDSTGAPNTGSWTFKVTYTVANLGPYSIEVTGNDNTPDIEAYVVQSKSKA